MTLNDSIADFSGARPVLRSSRGQCSTHTPCAVIRRQLRGRHTECACYDAPAAAVLDCHSSAEFAIRTGREEFARVGGRGWLAY